MEHTSSKVSVRFIESNTVTAYASIQATFGSPNWMPPLRGKHGLWTVKDQVMIWNVLHTFQDWSGTPRWTPPHQLNQPIWESSTRCGIIGCDVLVMGGADHSSSTCGWTPPPQLTHILLGVTPGAVNHHWWEQVNSTYAIYQGDAGTYIDWCRSSIDARMSGISLAEESSSDEDTVLPSHGLVGYKDNNDSLWLFAHSILYHYTLDDLMPSNPRQLLSLACNVRSHYNQKRWRLHKVHQKLDKGLITAYNQYMDGLIGGLMEWRNLIFVVYDCNHYNHLLLAGRVGLSYPCFWKLIEWDCKDTDYLTLPTHLTPMQQFWVVILALVADAEQVVLEIW
ncbi:hypothetical protein J3A83DRAFT_4188412 [Scleroderma citrinum]